MILSGGMLCLVIDPLGPLLLPIRLHVCAWQGFFGPYLSQSIPHTARGSAVPYHYGSFRPTTQVRRHPKLCCDGVIHITLPVLLETMLLYQVSCLTCINSQKQSSNQHFCKCPVCGLFMMRKRVQGRRPILCL